MGENITGFERMTSMLKREKTDRICLYEHFWNDTQKEWTQQGHLQPGEDIGLHFGFDMAELWAFNLVADLDYQPEVVAETEDTVTIKDGKRRHFKTP